MEDKTHICVIRFSSMGDVAMSVPVLWELIHAHPQLTCTVVTKESFKAFFSEIPRVKVLTPDLDGKHKGIVGLWKLALSLRSSQIDAVADLHGSLRSRIICFFLLLMRIPNSCIDKGRREKKNLIRPINKKFEQLPTTHQRYANVLQKLGYEVSLNHFQGIPKRISPQFDVFLKNYLNNIGIAPFAAYQGKTYPLSKMEQVVAKLSRYPCNIWLFASKEHKQSLQKLQGKYANTFCVALKADFQEELSLISNLSLMVSMDSANAHIAAMFAVPTLVIWGVTHPYAGFAPLGDTTALLANRDAFPQIPTSVYGSKLPKTYEKAIETISPEMIFQAISKKLSLEETSKR